MHVSSVHAYDLRKLCESEGKVHAEGHAPEPSEGHIEDCFRCILRLSDQPESELKTSAGGSALAAPNLGHGQSSSAPFEADISEFDRGVTVRPAVQLGVYFGAPIADGSLPGSTSVRHAAYRTAHLRPHVRINPEDVSLLGAGASLPSSEDVCTAAQPPASKEAIVEIAVLEPQLMPTPVVFALIEWLSAAAEGSSLGYPPRSQPPSSVLLDQAAQVVRDCVQQYIDQSAHPVSRAVQAKASDENAKSEQLLPKLTTPSLGGLNLHVALHLRKPSIILVKSVIDKKTSALALTLDLDVALFMLLGTGDLAASVDVSGLRAVRLDSRVALKDSPGAMTRQSRATAFLRYAVKTKMERERVPDETRGALPAVEIPGGAAHGVSKPRTLRELIADGAIVVPRYGSDGCVASRFGARKPYRTYVQALKHPQRSGTW